jgi:hypothetical protein
MFRNLLARVLATGALFAVGAMALVPGVSEAEDRPFKARLTGNASLSPTEIPWIMRNDETGEGQATHLGRFQFASVEYVNFIDFPPTVTVFGTFTMTAANGDELCGEYTTEGNVNMDGNLEIVGTFTFTGGTGRFAGATGGGDLVATAFLSEGLPFIGSYDGRIDY